MPAPTLSDSELSAIIGPLRAANADFNKTYPGESNRRQAVHSVYGGAHLFKSDTAQRLGKLALRSLREYGPDAATLAAALGLPENELASIIYDRVVEKLAREPTEDFRLDFEDGYGNRLEEEEDGHAASAALEVARGLEAGTLSPFLGIRIKPLNEDLRIRAFRTADIFISTLATETGGRLPENFVITVPKVQIPAQVTAAARFFGLLEKKTGLPKGSLRIELMLETPQAIINRQGELTLPSLIAAAEGRCGSVHFGVYDYTAGRNITAAFQTMRHSVCDFAREVMAISLAGTGIHLSDGATNILPVGPHRATDDQPLTDEQRQLNRAAVHRAWKLAFDDTTHSLENGIFQGWDLHPSQFIPRYAAVFAFFLGGLKAASDRLSAFVQKAALASLHGDVFDDAATGQGLLNFFLRGLSCGAITEEEALATGLTLEEIRSRSFLKILRGRRD